MCGEQNPFVFRIALLAKKMQAAWSEGARPAKDRGARVASLEFLNFMTKKLQASKCQLLNICISVCCLKLRLRPEPFLPRFSRSPVQVLVISLVFIAFVVLMHIYGKVRGSIIKEAI